MFRGSGRQKRWWRSNILKTLRIPKQTFQNSDKLKDELLLSEQSLFADTKQPSDSKIFVSNTIEDQTKIENCNGSDICAGVIKSFVPENHLRSHPGLKFSLNVSSLIQIMKSHISEKDSSSARTEVSNLVQSVDESTYVIVILMSS